MEEQNDIRSEQREPTEFFEVEVDGEEIRVDRSTLERFSKPVPRYTSYPTAVEWNGQPNGSEISSHFDLSSNTDQRPLSLYVHIPFCRSLCLFCGCNVIITRDEGAADRYLDYLEREINMVAASINNPQPVVQLHIGGGTPTFLSTAQLRRLQGILTEHFTFAPDAEISIEAEPRVTTREQLEALRELGYNRLSVGVQDFDPEVQKTIRRVHSFDLVADLISAARSLSFESINLDLIYGLPHQTGEGYRKTLDLIARLDPDRIALFSYAHVPWIKKQQRALRHHLPNRDEKFGLFAMAMRELTGHGYRHLGMDHFIKPDDELSQALDEGTLHRNFQGYTTRKGCDLLGFGVSAISDLGDCYLQNERKLDDYYRRIDDEALPTARVCSLSSEDQLRREVISSIMCRGEVDLDQFSPTTEGMPDDRFAPELERLRPFETEGFVHLRGGSIQLTPHGRLFVRNIASLFDAYFQGDRTTEKVFSNAI